MVIRVLQTVDGKNVRGLVNPVDEEEEQYRANEPHDGEAEFI